MHVFLLIAAVLGAFGPVAADGQNVPTTAWVQSQGYSTASAGLPSGAIILVASGVCPATYSEVAGLNGKFLQGTVAANGDVGTTGGSATITPSGTVSQPTLTMNAYTPAGTVAAPTFTGSQVTTSAVSAGTPSGTNGTVNFTPAGTVAAPVFTGSALATHAHELPFQLSSTTANRQIAVATFGTGTSRAATGASAAGSSNTTSAAVALSQAVSAGTPAGTNSAPAFTGTQGTVPAETFTGSALSTHTHTDTAAGTNSTPAFSGTQATLTGSVSQPTFTGQAIDPRPQYLKVIFCSKN